MISFGDVSVKIIKKNVNLVSIENNNYYKNIIQRKLKHDMYAKRDRLQVLLKYISLVALKISIKIKD